MVNATAEESDLDRKIGDLIAQIEEEMRIPKPSRREIDAFWKDSELRLFGKLAGIFPRFMYFNYDNWGALAKDSPYQHLHKAFEGSYRKLVPSVAAQIQEKNLGRIFSKGPSPEVDKLLLEELVRSGTPVTYHPVDINKDAVEKALKTVREHLNSKFGDSWNSLITLGENRAMGFNEARGKGKSCVIYSGGDLMNGIAMWEDAAATAQEGGIVVANAAVTLDVDDWSSYWLGMYENPQDRAMFMNGLKAAFPDLFSKKNKQRWDISFRYLQESYDWTGRWGIYQTPAIVAQLDVKEAMTVDTRDPVSGGVVTINLKPRGRTEPPVALGISTKFNMADFLQTIPENFGFKPIGPFERGKYVIEDINYEADGRHGHAAATIFEVGKPSANAIPAYDLLPKMLRA